MISERVPIRFHPVSGNDSIFTMSLRELTGKDEMAVQGIDTRSSIELLESLVITNDKNNYIYDMCASDRDSLLAAIQRQYWGDKIISTLKCSRCDEKFDLSFRLSELQEHISQDIKQWEAGGNLTAKNVSGENIRLPSAKDEITIGNRLNSENIKNYAEVLGFDLNDIDVISKNMERAAPILDLELNCSCSECGEEQLAHFDIQSFLLNKLLNEREGLFTEVHYLASIYNWSLNEILDMPRTMRKTMARMLD